MSKFLCVGKAVFLILLLFQASCYAQQFLSPGKLQEKDFFLLGLVGYNYTSHHIFNYNVNKIGGGQVNVSSPTSGGSGVTCCVKFAKTLTEPISVKVRWQVDGCTYFEKDPSTGETDEIKRYHYKEIEAKVQRLAIGIPKYLETHFYPDGSVKVRLTDELSNPLLILSGDRMVHSYFPRCKNG